MNPSTSTEASADVAPVPGLDWNTLEPVAELLIKSAQQIIMQAKLVNLAEWPCLATVLYMRQRKGVE